jgi:hypothetical protein
MEGQRNEEGQRFALWKIRLPLFPCPLIPLPMDLADYVFALQ